MSDITLNGTTATFSVNIVGSKSGDTFMGTFEVKCFLNPLEAIKADKLNRELLGETNPYLAEERIQNLCFALSQLKQRVIKSPAGWKHPELDGAHLDANVVVEILNKAIEAETKHQKENQKKLEALQKKMTKDIKSGKIKEKEQGEEVDEITGDE